MPDSPLPKAAVYNETSPDQIVLLRAGYQQSAVYRRAVRDISLTRKNIIAQAMRFAAAAGFIISYLLFLVIVHLDALVHALVFGTSCFLILFCALTMVACFMKRQTVYARYNEVFKCTYVKSKLEQNFDVIRYITDKVIPADTVRQLRICNEKWDRYEVSDHLEAVYGGTKFEYLNVELWRTAGNNRKSVFLGDVLIFPLTAPIEHPMLFKKKFISKDTQYAVGLESFYEIFDYIEGNDRKYYLQRHKYGKLGTPGTDEGGTRGPFRLDPVMLESKAFSNSLSKLAVLLFYHEVSIRLTGGRLIVLIRRDTPRFSFQKSIRYSCGLLKNEMFELIEILDIIKASGVI